METPADARIPAGYGNVLGSAFRIALRNPVLWIFGFFLNGGSGLRFSSGRSHIFDMQGTSPDLRDRMEEMMRHILPLIIAVLPLVIAGVLVAITLHIIARGAMISGADRAARGLKPGFGDCLRDGLQNFWHLFCFGIVSVVFFAVLILPLVPAIIHLVQHRVGMAIGMFGLGLAVDALAGAVLAIAMTYGTRVLVLERRGPLKSWAEGFRLFGEHPGRSVALGLLWMVVMMTLSLLALFPAGLLIAPVVIGVITHDMPSIMEIVPLVLIGLPLFLVVSGWFSTFSNAYWGLGYRWARPWSPTAPGMVAGESAQPMAMHPVMPPAAPPESGPAPA